VGVYFVGELLKGTHWQQVVFPIQSEESYDHIRVSIYNFATTNQGNDFMVDDINLFVSQLPITAYQGEILETAGGQGTMAKEALVLKNLDKRAQRVDMWLRVVIMILKLTYLHVSKLPIVVHYLLFFLCQ
jgi:hypothetical protein